MREIRKIVVAVDFSEHSQRALDYAVGLAKQFGAELILFHCYELPIPAFGHHAYGTVAPESYVEAVRTAAIRNTQRWADKAREQGVPVREEVGAGLPANEIAALVEKVSADLIVMGTRGLSGLAHVLLGSVAERTIQLAPCPVLTIKAEEK